MKFQSKKPHSEYLKNKWINKHKSLQNKLWDKHGTSLNWLTKSIPGRHLAVGSLGGLMLLTTPASPLLARQHPDTSHITSDEDNNLLLANQLKDKVPSEMRALNPQEEVEVSRILSENFGFSVKTEIDGKRLNRSYGLIGGEQHLYRYPGDSLYKHAANAEDAAMYQDAGMAPGLGAWGYFAPSESQFSEKDKMKERYYIAVQTFLSPGFSERVAEYRDFYKYRKMLLVNPETGQSVVTDIADAGPSEYTGKHLGGSPEVMQALGLAGGSRKGAVLYFFIDDPGDSIPLGPIKVENNQS